MLMRRPLTDAMYFIRQSLDCFCQFFNLTLQLFD